MSSSQPTSTTTTALAAAMDSSKKCSQLSAGGSPIAKRSQTRSPRHTAAADATAAPQAGSASPGGSRPKASPTKRVRDDDASAILDSATDRDLGAGEEKESCESQLEKKEAAKEVMSSPKPALTPSASCAEAEPAAPAQVTEVLPAAAAATEKEDDEVPQPAVVAQTEIVQEEVAQDVVGEEAELETVVAHGDGPRTPTVEMAAEQSFSVDGATTTTTTVETTVVKKTTTSCSATATPVAVESKAKSQSQCSEPLHAAETTTTTETTVTNKVTTSVTATPKAVRAPLSQSDLNVSPCLHKAASRSASVPPMAHVAVEASATAVMQE